MCKIISTRHNFLTILFHERCGENYCHDYIRSSQKHVRQTTPTEKIVKVETREWVEKKESEETCDPRNRVEIKSNGAKGNRRRTDSQNQTKEMKTRQNETVNNNAQRTKKRKVRNEWSGKRQEASDPRWVSRECRSESTVIYPWQSGKDWQPFARQSADKEQPAAIKKKKRKNDEEEERAVQAVDLPGAINSGTQGRGSDTRNARNALR